MTADLTELKLAQAALTLLMEQSQPMSPAKEEDLDSILLLDSIVSSLEHLNIAVLSFLHLIFNFVFITQDTTSVFI